MVENETVIVIAHMEKESLEFTVETVEITLSVSHGLMVVVHFHDASNKAWEAKFMKWWKNEKIIYSNF